MLVTSKRGTVPRRPCCLGVLEKIEARLWSLVLLQRAEELAVVLRGEKEHTVGGKEKSLLCLKKEGTALSHEKGRPLKTTYQEKRRRKRRVLSLSSITGRKKDKGRVSTLWKGSEGRVGKKNLASSLFDR